MAGNMHVTPGRSPVCETATLGRSSSARLRDSVCRFNFP